ncbi:MAG: RNA polymerase sigma factor [Oscillospiraceae bacterium]
MKDDEIISQFRARDENAIEHTRQKYGRLIRSVAMGILRSAEDSEECENEVYLRAWNSIPPTIPLYLSAYLCKISRSVAIDRYNYNHAAKRGEALSIDELSEYLSSGMSAEDKLTESELTRLLNSFLKSQDYNTRVIFLRRYWFADSIKEIAQRLHISEGTVKVRLSRTNKKLRDYLNKNGYCL